MKKLFTIMILIIVRGLNARNLKKALELYPKLIRQINYGNIFEPPAEGGWDACCMYLQTGTGRYISAQ